MGNDSEPKEYLVYECGSACDGRREMLPADGEFLVIRLDLPENDLERLVASIYGDLTTNKVLHRALVETLERITNRPHTGGPIEGISGYTGGTDAGLAGRNTA